MFTRIFFIILIYTEILVSEEFWNQVYSNDKIVFSHENVIEYKESFMDVKNHDLCLVMEFAE